mgnify:CR=1 FL=1
MSRRGAGEVGIDLLEVGFHIVAGVNHHREGEGLRLVVRQGQDDRHVGLLGDVVEAQLPLLRIAAGAFRGDGDQQFVALTELRHGLLHHAAGLAAERDSDWSLGPSVVLPLPIFDWGAREADLDLAKAREVEQVAVYEKTVQEAFREVSDALAGRRWLAEQVAALTQGVAAQERITRLARLRYREGVADYLEVLDAERNLFTAQQQLLTTQRAFLQNGTSLFVALGGGLAVEMPS